jgi:hypothetical protein
MSLDGVVSVTITAQTKFPSRAGFGRALIAGYHTVFPERTRLYNKPSDMVADGFAQNDPLVRAATKLMSQSPKSPDFKIGRRASAFTQVIRITPIDTAEGVVTRVNIVSPDGTVTAITRTNGAAETVATIVTALQVLITAIADLTATDDVTHITCTADNAGELFDYKDRNTKALDLEDLTADPGIAADLAAIRLDDPDWCGLALDSNSKAEVAAALAWAEAETVLFGYTTADSTVPLATAGNIFETASAAAYGRSHGWYHPDLLSYFAHGIMGVALPQDAGSLTWAYKTVAGVPIYVLTATEVNNIEGNSGNYYIELASQNKTLNGVTADGDFIDVQRTIDALSAGIQEDVAGLIFTLPKLPYTNGSVSTVKGTIRGVIGRFQATAALDPETEPLITAPLVEDVAAADRAARILPDVEFQARLGGAIHKVIIEGTLVV